MYVHSDSIHVCITCLINLILRFFFFFFGYEIQLAVISLMDIGGRSLF